MDTRTASTLARGVTSQRGVRRGLLRSALLASTALVLASVAAGPGRAQDATWQTNPGSGDFFDANNWSPNSVPSGTATFGASNITTVDLNANGTYGGWTFNAGASNYTFNIQSGAFQIFLGDGIVINGGSATITNNGILSFSNTSTAGTATITNNVSLQFNDTSTAGGATITNNNFLTFDNTSTAGSATITSNGFLQFYGTSTAGSANITNSSLLQFFQTSNAGSATITNNSVLQFHDTSSADTAAITNNVFLDFLHASTAGSATITNTNNSVLRFFNTSTAGNAAIINNAGGTVDFSGSTGPNGDSRLSAGSIAGAGNYILGANELTVGSNNLSTEVSGVISGTGSLEKIGTGTLTLTGANTYSGGTTINGGGVQLGLAGGATGSIQGAVTVGLASTFNVINADTSGITTITNRGSLRFFDTNSAGSATIFNNSGGTLSFNDTSSAGNATITNNSDIRFYNSSSAGSALAFINNNDDVQFNDTSTAGSSTIVNNNTLAFTASSNAGNATINNSSSGAMSFEGSASAGSATITNIGTLSFWSTSTGGTATITNNVFQTFYQTSSAGSSTVYNNFILDFLDSSTAGSATINNSGTGLVRFNDTSTAGSSTIINNALSSLQFNNSSTAGDATITNGGTMQFGNVSTAGNATITNTGMGYLRFNDNSNAGNAALINSSGGTVDFLNSTGPNGDNRLSAGSIAGAGFYLLGANELTVGSNNLSTEVSGVISGTGSLVKTGTGTLTLTGNNTYTGGTTVAGGTLQFGNGVSGGVITQAGSINVTGGTLAIQAPAILNVVQNVTLGNNTALSITAGAASPALSADSLTIGNGVAFNISGITDASQLDMVLINTTSGISGDFASINVGGFAGTVDYLTATTHKSADGLQYLASYGLTWNAGNNLANGTFTLTNATDSFTVGAVLADQAANPATGWNGTSLTKAGAGTLILTGTNTYSGGTTISGGTLQIGNGGTTGSITGNVVNNSVLAFNRSDATTFAGVVSGSGAVQQIGSGTLTLTADNTYTGGTTIFGGTLQIGNGGTAGSITGNVVNDGALAFNRSDAITFAGVISGSGAVQQIGTGTTILTGANTYSGGTTIFGGTLQIGNGGTAGSITGNVVNNGVLAFNRSDAVTFAGAISGNGAVQNIGTGTLTLTGDSSGFTGTTTIAGGMLAVNGSLGGMVDVQTTGRLQGIGTVGGATVSGTMAPGNSIGTLNIAGNVTFAAGSIYEVEVNAAGQSDRIIATGAATINGGSVRVLAGAGNYASQTQYTILTASGGRTGTFTGGVTSNLAFLDPSLSYDANNVYLTMTRNNIDFAGVGLTANQIATGGGVESLGWGSPLYDAVVNLSAPQARHAFEQLSGEIHASARTALIEDSRFIRNAVNDRIRAAFDAVGASGTVSTYDGGKPVTVKANTDRFAIWGQGFGSWGHTSGDGNAARLNRKTGGFFFGADAPVFDTWRFGAVAGYSQTSFDVKDRRSSGSSDNYYVGLYGGTAWGDLAFRTGAAYTWHDVSTNRSVMFPGFGGSLKGDYNAATAQMFGELAYGFNAGSARFEPFANLAYVNLHTDGFTEQGGAAALAGASDNTDSTFATLGLRASTAFDIGGTTLTAKGMVGWRHAFGDMVPTSTMRFAGGGNTFAIGGVPIAEDAAVIEAGLDYAITPSATLGVSYGGQFGSGMSDQSARFNFNAKF